MHACRSGCPGGRAKKRNSPMKKMIASLVTAVLLSAGLLMGSPSTAHATYGPPAAAKHVIRDVNKAVNKPGKISKKKAKKLISRVKLAKKLGLIKPRRAAILIKKIKKDTRK